MDKKKEVVKPYGLTVELSFTVHSYKTAEAFYGMYMPMLERALQHESHGNDIREASRQEKWETVAEYELIMSFRYRFQFVQNVFHAYGFLLHWASLHKGTVTVIQLLSPEKVEDET